MFRFSRIYRLTAAQDFRSIFANSRKIKHKYLLALYRPNQLLHARLGIIISKQRVRKAVVRNQIRRVIRESFRHHKEAVKGLDIIVLLRSECNARDQTVLRKDIDYLWPMLAASSKPVASC